ncbi:aa3-type cytochrome oxidase subunit IV [Streptomyces sp. NPDC001222]|uniref:aa3-type cytochrome oxidase subunit IV n=1 Tax=Streptomyces sp. NPDC001222 TaxID=3364548 RepID=UPI00369090AA
MKSEAYLFAGVALFFLLTDAAYIWFAREPAGIAALTVSFAMSSLVSFFCLVNYRRKGLRPEDRPDSEIRDRSGVIDFFPPQSGYPVTVALGAAVIAVGIVYAVWIVLIGFGILWPGVLGMVFQFSGREGD